MGYCGRHAKTGQWNMGESLLQSRFIYLSFPSSDSVAQSVTPPDYWPRVRILVITINKFVIQIFADAIVLATVREDRARKGATMTAARLVKHGSANVGAGRMGIMDPMRGGVDSRQTLISQMRSQRINWRNLFDLIYFKCNFRHRIKTITFYV